jgi:hypothetical protein
MKRNVSFALLAFLTLTAPAGVVAQSDDFISLGDFARSLRKGKEPAAPVVIDNDNLSRIMDDVESSRLNGKPLLSLDSATNSFKMSSPDGTCSLSFNANVTSLLTTPYVAEDVPQSELAKLEGPASIDGDNFRVTVFNGSSWDIKEITVGLTIVRRAENTAAYYGNAHLLPATAREASAQESSEPDAKPSDLTLLFHLKGTAAPLVTTIFREKLTAALAPEQEWHWAIIDAKGVRAERSSLPDAGWGAPAPVSSILPDKIEPEKP